MTSTIAVNATQVLKTAIPTVTVTFYPSSVFLGSGYELLSITSAIIFFVSVTVGFILGFNRMIAVPILAALAGIISNSMDWYANASTYALVNRRVALDFASISWSVQELVLMLYSFFLLEKILRHQQRRIFIIIFSIIFLGLVCIRIALLVIHHIMLVEKSLIVTSDKIKRWYFFLIAVLECWSAYFLLRTFYGARKRSHHTGLNSGLFSRLAHSSEIRVAALAGIGITRTACTSIPGDVTAAINNTAYIVQNAFPFVLLMDLLLTRNAKLQAMVDGNSGGELCNCGRINGINRKVMEKPIGSADSPPWSNALGSGVGSVVTAMESDYEAHVGNGYSGDNNKALKPRAGISKISEEMEERA